MGKLLPFDRNVIAVQPANDHAAPVTVQSLETSSKRHHQGITTRSNNHRAGLAVLEEEKPGIPAEQMLWLAVIARIMEDATAGLTIPGATKCDVERVRNEAVNWFTDNSRDFRDVCILAGLDPDAVRWHALKAIKEAKAQNAPAPRRLSRLGRSLMATTALSPLKMAA
jgi:hypothetical protein